ncbi:Fe2+-dependent dioxygenase [Kordiimonas sp.]|uniref:Fe2+-dependent dioxygenase n=1 Tax=Kordiimonas sp. TaxID=1970157 RepID=UPI003A9089B9
MFHVIPNLLDTREIARLRELAARMPFEDGRHSNPGFSKKKNLQPKHSDPGYKEASLIVQQGLSRNEYFRDFTYPKTMAPPMLSKYEAGMEYGEHVDNAIIPYSPPLRIDVSCTVFVSEPESYEGGELVVRMADKELKIKEKAGAAVLYPSNMFHHVAPVTKGTRLVAITFIESMVRDTQKREILVELTEFLHANAAKVGEDEHVRLEYIRQNLTRMWYAD